MEKLTLQQFASDLGISKTKAAKGIIDGNFPFATAIMPAEDSNEKIVYVILKSRYDKWKKGEFMG